MSKRSPSLKNTRNQSDSTSKFLFILGFLSPLNLQFLGKIYLIEFFFLAVVLNNFFTKRNLRIPTSNQVKTFLLLGTISAFMGSVGTLVNGLPLTSLIKGISLIVFLMINCYAVLILCKYQVHLIVMLYTGIATSSIVKYFIAPDEYTQISPWKFCFASAISIYAILNFPNRIPKIYFNSLLFILSAINFFLSFRTEGAVLLCTVLLFIYGERFKVGKESYIKLAISAFLLTLFLGSIYNYASNAGLLGSNLQKKSVIQSTGKYGILLGGRNEVAFSLPAVREKPLLGWGFYAPPSENIIDNGLQFLYENRVNTIYQKKSILEINQIPTHSFLMQFMVFGGVLAGMLWIFVLKILSQATLVAISSRTRENIDYLVVYISLLTISAILFSPFGAFERVNVGILIAFLSIYMAKRKVLEV